ncbi:hypothetical protein C923_00011 [Plasmodium falciparum UGT5.1]|uniref:Surface antigen n=1 Tax=Plasmodium falciparum UGT5.1 TaxID=1237627 RepID=W7K5I5_PLAFA|nr:hypothetical protein C923_00011 [Plasmodium falciparum UGT5.1]
MWKTTEIAAATKAAIAAGESAGKIAGEAAGVAKVIARLEELRVDILYPKLLKSIGDTIPYTNAEEIANSILGKFNATCNLSTKSIITEDMCQRINFTFGMRTGLGGRVTYGPPPAKAIPDTVSEIVEGAKVVAESTKTQVATAKTAALETAQKGAIEAASMQLYTTIAYSILAILIIVLKKKKKINIKYQIYIHIIQKKKKKNKKHII